MELEPGVEGLVHVSEMSWTKKAVHPGKIVSTSEKVEVMVIEVDPEKRRISLGLKQCIDNPWDSFSDKFPIGATVEGEIRNITEFGLFVGLDGDIDGMVHMSDLSWEEEPEVAINNFTKGQVVQAQVREIDPDKGRISLSVKHMSGDPFKEATSGIRRGETITCTVRETSNAGVEVETSSGAIGFIRRAELARDRDEQRPDRFAVGESWMLVSCRSTRTAVGWDFPSRRLKLPMSVRRWKSSVRATAVRLSVTSSGPHSPVRKPRPRTIDRKTYPSCRKARASSSCLFCFIYRHSRTWQVMGLDRSVS